MKFLKLLYGAFDAVQSHNSPPRVACGFALGAMFGMFPPVSLQGLLLLVVIAGLRINLPAVIAGALGASWAAALFAQELLGLGRSLLVAPSLTFLWAFLDAAPLLPFLRAGEAAVLGRTIAGVVAAPLMYACARAIYPRVQKPLYRWLWEQPFFRNTMGTRLYRLYANYTKKSTIRWGGLRLAAATAVVVLAGSALFADMALKRRAESQLSRLNGARVEIGRVGTNWLAGTSRWERIAVTNYRSPLRNFIEIGAVEVRFRPWPLLSGKLHVTSIGVEGVRYDTQRAGSGEIETPATVAVAEDAAAWLGGARSGLSGNPLMALSGNFRNPDTERALREYYGELAFPTNLSRLQSRIEREAEELVKLETRLPSFPDIDRLASRLAGREPAHADEPDPRASLRRSLETTREVAEAMRASLDGLEREVTRTADGLAADVDTLKSLLAVPSLDENDLSSAVFGDKLLNATERIASLILLGRAKMPAGDRRGDVHVFSNGNAFRFERELPRFVVEEGTIGAPGDALSGRFSGISSSPALIDRPAVFSLSGDIPDREIAGVSLEYLGDHRGAMNDRFELRIARFPLVDWTLRKNSDMELVLEHARAALSVSGTLAGDRLDAALTLELETPKFRVRSRNQELEDSLTRIIRETGNVKLTGRLSGPPGDVRLILKSALGKRLSAALRARFASSLELVDRGIEDGVRSLWLTKSEPLFDRIARLREKRHAGALERLERLERLAKDYSPSLS